MLSLIDRLVNSLFLLALKIIGAIVIGCASYIAAQMFGKILINTITKM